MKKLISCLLVIMMLFTVTHAFAASARRYDIVSRFLKETDTKTKDLALQVKLGDEASDLVFRLDGDNLHLVSHDKGVEDGHVQLNPTGVYLDSDGTVTLLRYATVTTVIEDILKEVDTMLDNVIKSIPEDQLPTEEEIKKALNEMGIMAAAVQAQAQADASTLTSAAIAFANKFKPEYILDVKQDMGSLEISLRSDAYAAALAEAMDEMMTNPELAELVNRQGGAFGKIQQDWALNREAILEAVSSVESTKTIDENGHIVSHFQIGEETEESKVLMYDTDAWIDAENDEAEIKVSIGFKDEDPLMVHELVVDPFTYNEKLTSGDSMTETQMTFEDNRLSSGNVLTVIEGEEALRADFGPDYLYMRSPKGSISTTVRETFTGKIRYELIAETAEGEESSIILDFYQDDDSLVCELYSDKDDEPAVFKISRIDKGTIKDLSTSENINEITVDQIKAELEPILKLFQ